MKQQDHSQSVGALLLGSVVIVILIVTSIRTLERFNQNEAGAILTIGTQITLENNSATPEPSDTQTISFLITEKAIVIATIAAITRTPYDTPIIPPTGTRENQRVEPSGKKLGLQALNAWAGLLDGNQVSIYSGSLLEDLDQGAIVILITLPYRNFEEKILTPTRHGGVRVVGEHNNRLTLLATDGEMYFFDVPARRFVTSLDEFVPTATPPPTYTPYPTVLITPVPTIDPYPMPTSTPAE